MSWEKVRLSEVIEKPLSGEWGEEGDDIFVLRTTNFSNDGTLDLTSVVKRNIPLAKVERKRLLFGDTILEKSGGSPSQPVGRVVYFNIESEASYLCNNFTSVLRSKKNADSKYVFWFLFNNHITKKTLQYQNKTTGIINLQTERYLEELQIPLPTLSAQKKVAAILDLAAQLRKKDQQLLAHYDALLQSIFYDMFGDPVINDKGWKKLNGEEYSKKISVGVVIQPASYYVEKGVIALRSLNIRPNEIVLNNLVYFSKEAHLKILSKSILNAGDVVLVRTGATGTAAVVPENLGGCNCIDLIIVKPDITRINPFFLSIFFNSDFAKKVVSGKEVGGIQKHFNIGAIKALKIPVPPVELQNKFASIAKNIEQQRQQIKQQLQQSEDLFQTLLQKAFNGELIK
jgi:type I restriction enzyme S subunit